MKPALSFLQRQLRQSHVFAQVPAPQLEWLANKADYLLLKNGDYLFHYDDPIDKMAILLKGHMVVYQKQGTNRKVVKELSAGDVSGALPYSRAEKAIAQSQATENCELLMLPEKYFKEMIGQHYELTEVLVHTMTSRVRTYTQSRQQSEKMAALGKLSAGLAHELNNPASAVVRSSSALKEQLLSLPSILSKILRTRPDPQAFDELHQLLKHRQSAVKANEFSLVEKNSLEEELSDWLREQQITNPYETAETLTALQLQKNDLQELGANLKPAQLSVILSWLSQLLSIEKLADEIYDSSCRISELVQAVKSYSHMDKSPDRQETDLLQGIKNTLTMLNFKIKKKGIRLQLQCPDHLPKACVYPGELNQVWTNLLDNAIDAVKEDGQIEIQLSQQDNFIVVSIKDNGEGIKKEEQEKIFDPFFTTKTMGNGSGLGLDIVKRIVDHHQGRIELNSQPGNTQFTISIPLS